MVRLTLLVALLPLAATPAAAQDHQHAPGEHASEGSPEAPDEPSPDELSDEELIRWAAREIGSRDGRSFGQYPPVPPDGYLTSSSQPHPFPGESNAQAGLRLLAELGGGSLGLLLGGGAGTLLIWAALEGRAHPTVVAIAFGAGTILGSLALTAGVTLAADLMGGHGNFGYAFIGQVVGAVAALPLVVLGQANDALGLSLLAAGILPLAGALLGYEIGHSDHAFANGASAYLAPIEGGAVAGVAGPLL